MTNFLGLLVCFVPPADPQDASFLERSLANTTQTCPLLLHCTRKISLGLIELITLWFPCTTTAPLNFLQQVAAIPPLAYAAARFAPILVHATMFEPLRKMFRAREKAPSPAIPNGQRVYVVGDIHGRLDLFEKLIAAIEQDDIDAAPARSTVILLGDLVDRGPDSAGVVAKAREWQKHRAVHILAGNHEEMFLGAFEGKDVLRHFLRHGGRETVLSYGVKKKHFAEASLTELQALMAAAVPEEDRDFVAGFEDYLTIGDYLFVHAGIAPDVPMEEQKRRDMRWIREPFLRHRGRHSHIVVHGHTIVEEIDEQVNRIGIDTGAFRFGRLTALVLEGRERRYIQAVEKDGCIKIKRKESDT